MLAIEYTRSEHQHQLGHSCPSCGHVTVPVRFEVRDAEGEVDESRHDEAVAAYLAWLAVNIPDHRLLERPETRPEIGPRPVIRLDIRTVGRPAKWASEAERKRAYRQRKAPGPATP